jgi:periplasmic divalent cation tolerance protein
MGDQLCEVVLTAEDSEWLAAFSRGLVEERLAACGQIIGAIRSIYRWKGVVQDEAEARVALHTRADLVPRIIERTSERHSYEVPCVIAMPLVGGNPEYLEWVRAQTAP